MSNENVDCLKKEITSLNKQLILLGEARNKEILDLQRRFADQIRELQRSKGLDNTDEIKNLNKKITDLEGVLASKDQEINNLKSKNIDLEKKLKDEVEKNNRNSVLLEKSHTDLLKAQFEAAEAKKIADESSNKSNNIDYEGLLKPFEDQLEKLKEVITKQNAEIVGLRNLVHEECTERMRLQKQINQQQQTNVQQPINQQNQNIQHQQASQQIQDKQQNILQQQRDQLGSRNNRTRGQIGRFGGSKPQSKICYSQLSRNTYKLYH